MKLKLVAKITQKVKTSTYPRFGWWDSPVPPEGKPPEIDWVEAYGSFFTEDEQNDTEFTSAAEVYDFYMKNDWPEHWMDGMDFEGARYAEESIGNIYNEIDANGYFTGKVKLIDHGWPESRGYEVTYRLVKSHSYWSGVDDDDWDNADREILKVEEIK